MKLSVVGALLFCALAAAAVPLRVAVLHYRPPSLPPEAFEVGFVSATKLLEAQRVATFEWVNLDAFEGMRAEDLDLSERFGGFDVVFVKSNWEWTVDQFVRVHLREVRVPKVLLISGVHVPPVGDELHFYDVLVYETQWYARQIAAHPRTVRAFGIDTSVMRPPTVPREKDIDFLFIGAFVDYKRPWLLAEKPGRRVAVGKMDEEESAPLVKRLRAAGVEVLSLMSHHALAELIWRARVVYVPATVFGGGERSVLEARAAGARVEVEPDNAKLAELLRGPVLDHVYYARQLGEALRMTPLISQRRACGDSLTAERGAVPAVFRVRLNMAAVSMRVLTPESAVLRVSGSGFACVRRASATLRLQRDGETVLEPSVLTIVHDGMMSINCHISFDGVQPQLATLSVTLITSAGGVAKRQVLVILQRGGTSTFEAAKAVPGGSAAPFGASAPWVQHDSRKGNHTGEDLPGSRPLRVLILCSIVAAADQSATTQRAALSALGRYSSVFRISWWEIDAQTVEERYRRDGLLPEIPPARLAEVNGSDLVLGIGSFRSAADILLSYMHLNRADLGLLPVPKALWLAGSSVPWGEGVYSLLLATSDAHRKVALAMDAGNGHHNIQELPAEPQHNCTLSAAAFRAAQSTYVAALTAMLARGLLTAVAPAATRILAQPTATIRLPTRQPPPRRYDWAIGMMTGPSLFELSESEPCRIAHSGSCEGTANPIIHAGDVTDTSAVFVADPFVVFDDARFWLFFEVLPADMRGVIAVASCSASDIAQWQYHRVVIDEPGTHLSFPYVFKHSSSWYMTVEAHQAACVPLYKAVQFPYVWDKLPCLLTGATFQDNALLLHGGIWWLWTTIEMLPSEWQQHLYFSKHLEGPYRQHPRSPVVRAQSSTQPHFGCARGRLGGRLMEVPVRETSQGTSGSLLLRFVQATAPRYGERLDAWIVTKLTEADYEERWAGPVLLGRSSGQAGRSADQHSARRSWNANMMHQLDAIQLISPEHVEELRQANAHSSNGAAPRPPNVGLSTRWLAVVDGAKDGGGLHCMLAGAWEKMQRSCSARLAVALPVVGNLGARSAVAAPFTFMVHSAPPYSGVPSDCVPDNATAIVLFGPVASGSLSDSAISVSDTAHLLQPDGRAHTISAPGVFELVLSVSAHNGLFVHSHTLRFVVVDKVAGFPVQEAERLGAITALLPKHARSDRHVELSSLLAPSVVEQLPSHNSAPWHELLRANDTSAALAWARDQVAADARWLGARTHGATRCAVVSAFDLDFVQGTDEEAATPLHRVDAGTVLNLSFTSAVFVLRARAHGALWYATLLLASRRRPPICLPYLCLSAPGSAPSSLASLSQWELRSFNETVIRPGSPFLPEDFSNGQ